MEKKYKVALSVVAILAVIVVGGSLASEGDTTTTTVAFAAPTTTVQPATTTTTMQPTTLPPTTTTTRPPTTTTTSTRPTVTIGEVIFLTRQESLRYSNILWVDLVDDDTLESLATSICEIYEATDNNKNGTITLATAAFFDGYGAENVTEGDLELFVYFAGGVIDLLCEQ